MKNTSSTSSDIVEIVPYVWQKKSFAPGSTVTVLGGTHPNETVGIEVANQLLLYLIMNNVRAGIINVGFGNVDGIGTGKRYVEEDLNRCFGKTAAEKAGKSLSVEAARAEVLESILRSTDVLIDVHSTIKPSQPFVCVPDFHHPYAKYLPLVGVKTVLTGEGLWPPQKKPIYADTFVCVHGANGKGGMGITIETGWQQEKEKVTCIKQGILRMLQAIGVFSDDIRDPLCSVEQEAAAGSLLPGQMEFWDAYRNVIAGEHFSFVKEWKNFEVLSAGMIFAVSGETTLSVAQKSIILFPKPNDLIVPGQEVCIIAQEMPLFFT